MRRLGQFAWAVALTVAPLMAQEGHAAGEGESPTSMILLWVNFAILVGGLAWLIRKYGTPFLEARGAKIQRDLADAAELRKKADAQAADVDRRLLNLDASLAGMRAESQKEMDAQRRRIAEQMETEIAKIRANVEQEVATAGKAARAELKSFAGHLAIELAEQKIQSRITPDVDDRLLKTFLHGLPAAGAKAQTN